MGRKWANIKEKKAAKDANNSRVYAKFGIEIYVAAKSGDPDPHANQKLRFVIVNHMNNILNYSMKDLGQMVQWSLLML